MRVSSSLWARALFTVLAVVDHRRSLGKNSLPNAANFRCAGADRLSIRCILDERLPHYRKRRDGGMIAGALEVKKEISNDGRLVRVDSLPARDNHPTVTLTSARIRFSMVAAKSGVAKGTTNAPSAGVE